MWWHEERARWPFRKEVALSRFHAPEFIPTSLPAYFHKTLRKECSNRLHELLQWHPSTSRCFYLQMQRGAWIYRMEVCTYMLGMKSMINSALWGCTGSTGHMLQPAQGQHIHGFGIHQLQGTRTRKRLPWQQTQLQNKTSKWHQKHQESSSTPCCQNTSRHVCTYRHLHRHIHAPHLCVTQQDHTDTLQK